MQRSCSRTATHTTAFLAEYHHRVEQRVCVWGIPLILSQVTGTRGGSGGTHSLRGLLGQQTAWHPLLVHTDSPPAVSDKKKYSFIHTFPTLSSKPVVGGSLVRTNYFYHILNHGYELN